LSVVDWELTILWFTQGFGVARAGQHKPVVGRAEQQITHPQRRITQNKIQQLVCFENIKWEHVNQARFHLILFKQFKVLG
jgi:hypothetical protein